MIDAFSKALWAAIVPLIVAAILAIFGMGCVAGGTLKHGKVNAHYQPGIGFITETWILFNKADRNLVEMTDAAVSGKAETVEAEPDDAPDD